MIICDVCETLIIVTSHHYGRILCPNCNFDNTYQTEDSGFLNNIILTLDEYESLDDDTLIQLASERFGLSEDFVIEIIQEQELVGKQLHIKKEREK